MRSVFSACLLVCVSFAAVSWALASEAPDAQSSDVVVVTATRTEQPVQRVGDSVTVIDAPAVRASQKTAVSDLLSTTPGVTVSRNGGFGSTTSLRIRGAETDQTVVLIDGVKLNDPSSPGGGYDFGDLLTDDLSRIEVLRGPQSTLWGSQAIGGVVNLVTPVPEGPLSGAVMLDSGTRETSQVRAKAEAGGDRVAWRVGGSYFTTQGISAFDERLGGKEKDGYRQANISGRLIVRLSDSISADLRSTYRHARVEFDGFPPPAFTLADTPEYGWTRETVAYAGLNAESFGGRWKHRVGYAFTDVGRQNFDPSASVPKTFDAVGRNGRWEYQGTMEIAAGYEAVFGLESERSQFTTASPSTFDPNPVPLARDVQLNSTYGQIQATLLPAVTLTAGLRHDHHDTFGGKTTGRAALAWSVIDDRTIVRATYGEGFKAPTLYQLFSQYGNRALRPEAAQGWDAGVEQHALAGALVVAATYFDRDATNQIDFVSCFGSSDPRCAAQPFGFYDNVRRTTARGVELTAALKAGERLTTAANFTHTDAENAASGTSNFGHDLPRRARDTAYAEASYHWPVGLATTVAVQYVGRTFDDVANRFPLDAYTLVELRAAYTASRRLEIFGRVENALDRSYETARGYGSLRRGVFFGLRTTY